MRSMKKRRLSSDGEKQSVCVRYAIAGKQLCLSCLCRVVQMSRQTVHLIAKAVHKEGEFQLSNFSSCKQQQKGTIRIQGQIVVRFLRQYRQLHGPTCPTGRGSRENETIRLLPTDTEKSKIHEVYLSYWPHIVSDLATAPEFDRMKMPTESLPFRSFLKVWRQRFPILRIARFGTDFCDTCTHLRNQFLTTLPVDARDIIVKGLQQHRQHTFRKYKRYKEIEQQLNSPSSGSAHLTFGFAEKLSLPVLLKQPG